MHKSQCMVNGCKSSCSCASVAAFKFGLTRPEGYVYRPKQLTPEEMENVRKETDEYGRKCKEFLDSLTQEEKDEILHPKPVILNDNWDVNLKKRGSDGDSC